MAIALPALPPLLTSPIETAPPLAEAVATPALPALAVSVCSKRSSNDWRDSADQLFRLLLRLLLLPLLLWRWLLLRSRSLPASAARLPVPPLASLMLVPPSATTSRTVAFSTTPPLTATQRSPPPRWASALETVTAPRFSATTAAAAIDKNRALRIVRSPSLSRVGSVRLRRIASGAFADRSVESPERL